MRTIAAKAPDKTEWAVRVVWEPRWPLLVRRFGGWRAKRKARKRSNIDGNDVIDVGSNVADAGSSPGIGDDFLVVLAVVIGIIVFGALFWWLLLPLLLVFVDLIVVLALLVLATLARVLFGRPWTVEAVTTRVPRDQAEQRFEVFVVGWRRALHKRDEIAAALTQGASPAAITGPTDAPVTDPLPS